LDVGAIVGGFYGDGAITVSVGEVQPPICQLIQVTREALSKGIEQAVVGQNFMSIL